MNKLHFFSACLLIAIIFSGCSKKDSAIIPNVLSVQTTTAGSVTQMSAITGGTISSDGGNAVTKRGICWSLLSNPTLASNKTLDGSGNGSFTSTLTSLSPNTTYYVKAYAINSKDTAYGAQISFTTQPLMIPGNGVTDIDGNTYTTVILGGKEWMVQNLRTTRYRNGDLIPNITDQTLWKNATAGGWCNYNNVASYNSTYGKIYNLYCAIDPRQLAPNGWHVPSGGEYTVLVSYLGGNSIAGPTLKEAGAANWPSPNTGTNTSGFTALPGGYRATFGTGFYDFGSDGYWGTTDAAGSGSPFTIHSNSTIQTNLYATQNYGFSIRCVKD